MGRGPGCYTQSCSGVKPGHFRAGKRQKLTFNQVDSGAVCMGGKKQRAKLKACRWKKPPKFGGAWGEKSLLGVFPLSEQVLRDLGVPERFEAIYRLFGGGVKAAFSDSVILGHFGEFWWGLGGMGRGEGGTTDSCSLWDPQKVQGVSFGVFLPG